MTRKTVTICNNDLIDYIKLESRRKRTSASRVMEEMMLESLSSRLEKDKEEVKIDTKFTDSYIFPFIDPSTGGSYYSQRFPLKVNFNALFSFFDVFDIHYFDNCRVKKSNKLDSSVKMTCYKKQMDDVIYHIPSGFNFQGDNILCIPIALLYSPKIVYINSSNDDEVISLMDKVDDKLNRILMEKYHIANKLVGILEEIKMLLNTHQVLINIISDGELLPFYVERNYTYGNSLLELLNIKYTRYKDIDELSIIPGDKLCLLKGKYGYLYCRKRLYPYSFDDLKKQYLDKIKKKSIEDIDNKLNERVVKFIIPEPVEIANKSNLITLLIDILRKIRCELEK